MSFLFCILFFLRKKNNINDVINCNNIIQLNKFLYNSFVVKHKNNNANKAIIDNWKKWNLLGRPRPGWGILCNIPTKPTPKDLNV